MNKLKRSAGLALLAITLQTSAAVYAADATVDALTVDVAVTKNKADNNSAKIESTQAGAKATQDALQAEMANRVAADEALANSITNISLTPGPQGDQGIQGLIGAKGDQGIQGLTGDVGATGLPGLKGETGAQGDQGLPGSTGAAGPLGLAGNDGAPGANGSDGTNGINGVDSTVPGPPGIQGPAGADGAAGADGLAGAKGARGIQGATGPAGSQGDPGPAGTADEKLYARGDPGPANGIVIYVTHDRKHGIEVSREDARYIANGQTKIKMPFGCELTQVNINRSMFRGIGAGEIATETILRECPDQISDCGALELNASILGVIGPPEGIPIWEHCNILSASLPIAALAASGSAAGGGAENPELGGYYDWYLPNVAELAMMYRTHLDFPHVMCSLQFNGCPGHMAPWYWSSNDDRALSTTGAQAMCFSNEGTCGGAYKGGDVLRMNRKNFQYVRAVRKF